MKTFKKIISLLMALTLLACTAVLPYDVSAATAFESSISGFPESYKVKLRKLHSIYENWTFTPLVTGLNWSDVVANECKYNKSLVPYASGYSDILKSNAAGDYNASTGTYIQKDSGWVTANEIAVSYFMDPRNFLNVGNIFQFEALSFVSSSTVQAVEQVLKGSFMANKYISYYNSDGKLQTTTKKYSTVIYNAGKKYNINPCYIASKILNEVGSNGSSSVSGTYSGYEGLYNFYNIGASDGAGAIARGLTWASSDSTYGRPWTTPEKSIYGGAQFLAEKYIAKGQNTGYLQKFQVNPSASYALYDHQYMTNVSGANSQGYTTYLSYLNNGTLTYARNFIIPVFKNMPGEKEQSTSMKLADSCIQTGTATETCNVRTGPSTTYNALGVTLAKGTTVKILGKTRTDSTSYLNFLRTPYWCKVSFSSGGKTYTGYVCADYVSIKTKIVVSGSSFNPKQLLTSANSDDYAFLKSSDTSVATVKNNTVSLLKNGSFELTAYTLSGGYDKLLVKVDKAATTLSDFTASSIGTTTMTLKWNSVKGAGSYFISVFKADGSLQTAVTTTQTSYKLTGLTPGAKYNICVRSISTAGAYAVFASKTVSTAAKPKTVTGCIAVENSGNGIALLWNKVSCKGYRVYKYDSTSGKYVSIGKTTSCAYLVNDKIANAGLYKVRAYNYVGGSYFYSSYSAVFAPNSKLIKMTSFKQKNTTKDGYTLYWNAAEGATGYYVYRLNASTGKFTRIANVKTTSYIVDNMAAGSKNTYRVRAYMTVGGVTVYGKTIQTIAATRTKAPTGLKVVSIADGKVKIDWSNTTGADFYYVYLYDTATSSYKRVAKTTKSYYTLTGLKATATNFYVRAIISSSSGNLASSRSSVLKVASSLQVPSNVITYNASGYVGMKWSAVPMAQGYEIRRYNSSTGKYVVAMRTTDCAYHVYGLNSGNTFYYKIRAYFGDSTERIYSAYTPTYRITAK